jgi:hypothetical protein
MSLASMMGPPFRQWHRTTSGGHQGAVGMMDHADVAVRTVLQCGVVADVPVSLCVGDELFGRDLGPTERAVMLDHPASGQQAERRRRTSSTTVRKTVVMVWAAAGGGARRGRRVPASGAYGRTRPRGSGRERKPSSLDTRRWRLWLLTSRARPPGREAAALSVLGPAGSTPARRSPTDAVPRVAGRSGTATRARTGQDWSRQRSE